jgi:hypothetical protein
MKRMLKFAVKRGDVWIINKSKFFIINK